MQAPCSPIRWPLWVLTPLLAVVPHGVRAGSVTVQIEPSSGTRLAEDLGIDLVDLEKQLADGIEEAFYAVDSQAYLRGMANAQAFANRGLGVDYASNPTAFAVGGGASLALSLGDKGMEELKSDSPVVGFAPNVSLMAGLNLGVVGLQEQTLYLNYFSRSAVIDEREALGVTLSNFGLHWQYKLFRPDGDAIDLLFQWGGFDLTTGLEYSSLTLKLQHPIKEDLPLQGAGAGSSAGATARIEADGTLDVGARALTVPLEISTNVRLLYVLTLFAGAGLDVQMGDSDVKAQLEGDLVAKDPRTEQDVDLGHAAIRIEDRAGPSPGRLRFFGGAQVNAWMLKAFAQLNVAPGRAAALTLGARVAW